MLCSIVSIFYLLRTLSSALMYYFVSTVASCAVVLVSVFYLLTALSSALMYYFVVTVVL